MKICLKKQEFQRNLPGIKSNYKKQDVQATIAKTYKTNETYIIPIKNLKLMHDNENEWSALNEATSSHVAQPYDF